MDWKTGIELLMQKLSAVDIATECGLSVSGVYDLKNGYTKEPRGMAAVNLHAMIAAAEKLDAGEPSHVEQEANVRAATSQGKTPDLNQTAKAA